MHRLAAAMLFTLCLALAGACTGSSGPAPTATQDSEAQAQQTRAAGTKEAAATEGQRTRAAEQTRAAAVVLTRQRSTEAAVEWQETQVAGVTATVVRATAQSQSMLNRVQELHALGYLGGTAGTFHSIPDFDESWAQLNWYQWWATGLQPTDFVIRTDVTWESASDTADWWNSGCGFVFRVEDSDNHYFAYLALDGRFYFVRRINDRPGVIARPFVARPDLPIGQASLEMIAEGNWFTFFVNGEKVHSRQDTALAEGELALTLVSGTNKDFGTRCQMRNIELWELE